MKKPPFKRRTDDLLLFMGTNKVDHSFDCSSTQARHVRQVYSSKCDECGHRTRWYRWVRCETGVRGPGRPLSKRRHGVCAFCAVKNYRPKKKVVVESDLDKWMREHGRKVGVMTPPRLRLVTSSHTGKVN